MFIVIPRLHVEVLEHLKDFVANATSTQGTNGHALDVVGRLNTLGDVPPTFDCDFVSRDRALIVEVDGDTHDRAADADRDYALGRLGYRVLRFTNAEVAGNLAGVLRMILETIEGRPTKVERLEGRTRPPPPSLGREGEV